MPPIRTCQLESIAKFKKFCNTVTLSNLVNAVDPSLSLRMTYYIELIMRKSQLISHLNRPANLSVSNYLKSAFLISGE